MANLTEVSNFDATVHELALTDPVLGGPGGIDNAAAQALANRTRWLYNYILNKIFVSHKHGGGVNVLNTDQYRAIFTGDIIPTAGSTITTAADYTTPNDGVTRTYKITVSCRFTGTTPSAGSPTLGLYNITSGILSGGGFGQLSQLFATGISSSASFSTIVSLAPNSKLLLVGSNITDVSTINFSAPEFIIEEI